MIEDAVTYRVNGNDYVFFIDRFRPVGDSCGLPTISDSYVPFGSKLNDVLMDLRRQSQLESLMDVDEMLTFEEPDELDE